MTLALLPSSSYDALLSPTSERPSSLLKVKTTGNWRAKHSSFKDIKSIERSRAIIGPLERKLGAFTSKKELVKAFGDVAYSTFLRHDNFTYKRL